MKKITLYSIIGTLSCSSPFTSAQTWDLSGNAAIVPGTDMLGTTDATPIPFVTNGFERMRLDATGNLGIGLTTPAYHLDILSPAVAG